MANTFRNFSQPNISTANTAIYKADVTSHSATIILGFVLANKSSNSIKATVYLDTATAQSQSTGSPTNANTTLFTDVPIPSGSSLEVFQGQKLVLNTDDILTVKSDTANSLDSVLSIMEQTT